MVRIDIIQSRDCITIHVLGSYLWRVIDSHGWTDVYKVTLLMSSDNDHVHVLDTVSPPLLEADQVLLEKLFRYRGGIGELIWAMITTRPEISFPTTKLNQFTAPAAVHYQAVKRVFCYLNSSITDGLTYWRLAPQPLLPSIPPPPRLAAPVNHPLTHDVSDAVEKYTHTTVLGYVESDWATNIRHRQVPLLPGNVVFSVPFPFPPPRLNSLPLPMLARLRFSFFPSSMNSV